MICPIKSENFCNPFWLIHWSSCCDMSALSMSAAPGTTDGLWVCPSLWELWGWVNICFARCFFRMSRLINYRILLGGPSLDPYPFTFKSRMKWRYAERIWLRLHSQVHPQDLKHVQSNSCLPSLKLKELGTLLSSKHDSHEQWLFPTRTTCQYWDAPSLSGH